MADDKGAPVDFGGRVLSNPDNVKPTLDSDARIKTDEPGPDAKMSIQNAALSDSTGTIKQHPLQQHFSKTKPRVQYKNQPVVSEN
jgi:hypothetical protein